MYTTNIYFAAGYGKYYTECPLGITNGLSAKQCLATLTSILKTWDAINQWREPH